MVLQLDRRRLPENGFQVLLSILAVFVVVGKCRFLSQLSYLPRHLGPVV